MKKLIPAIVVASSLAGCYYGANYKYQANYEFGIKKVVINGEEKNIPSWGASRPQNPMAFSDEDIKFYFTPTGEGALLIIENKSKSSVKVVWDESSMLIDGVSERVFHTGQNYIDANRSTPSSVIPAGASLKEGVFPSNYTHQRYYSNGGSYWHQAKILPSFYTRSDEENYPEFKKNVEALDGKDIFDLFLTVEINGQKREYLFDFEISSAKIAKLDESSAE